MKFQSKIGNLFAFTGSSNLKNPAQWLTQYFGGTKSSAGITVTPESALGVPEIWNAVSKVAGALAMMEMECIQFDETGHGTPMKNDKGASVYNSPNEMQTHSQAVHKIMVDALLMGNGRFYIDRHKNGSVKELIPIQARDCQTIIVDGERWHAVSIHTGTAHGTLTKDGKEKSTLYKIKDEDVFYVMGLSLNGYWGENLISLARDTIGLSIAGGESAGTIFQNSGRPGLLLEAPNGVLTTSEDAKAFLDDFNAAHAGIDNQGKTGLIRNGMKAMSMNYPSMDSSHVDMRQFQREAAALLFLLESVIGDDTGNVYKSVTERQAVFVTQCLGPWIKRIEQEADKKLMTTRNRSAGCRYRLDISPLYKNDRDGLALYTSSLRQQGAISGNDVRELHGLSRVPDLADDYHILVAGGNAADPTEEKQADPNKTKAGSETLTKKSKEDE